MKRGLCLIKIGDGFTNQLAALLNKSGENLEMNKQIPLEIGRYHCLFYKYAKGLVLNVDVREGDKYIGKPSIKEYFKYSTITDTSNVKSIVGARRNGSFT